MTYRSQKSLLMGIIFALIVLIAMFLSSCGPRFYAKKAKKAIAKAIERGAVIHADTLWKTLEVQVPLVKTDTVFKSQQGDTVWVREDRLKIRYIHMPGDTVQISGECEADTIVQRVPYTITQNITVPVKDNKWKWIAIGLGVVLIASIALKRLFTA